MKLMNILHLAVLGFVANTAYATTCPEVSDIKQSPMEKGGFNYTAPAPDEVQHADGGKAQWTGGDKWAEEKDLLSYVFKSMRIKEGVIDKDNPANNKPWTVICQYEGEGEHSRQGEANAIMTLKSAKKLALPAKDPTTPGDAKEVPTECGGKNKKPSDCSFN